MTNAELTKDLVELAGAHGVATDYHDWRGRHTVVSQETIVAVLAALGVRAGTDELVRAALRARRDSAWLRTLPACTVLRAGERGAVRVHLPYGEPARLLLHQEGAGPPRELGRVDRADESREVAGRMLGAATVLLPDDLPVGWHTLEAVLPGAPATAQAPLVVTPRHLGLPPSVRGPQWGLMTQLYSLRSNRSWSHGDLHDLAELASWSGRDHGAGFVLVNPLHAPALSGPIEPSPYLPVTRRFTSPLYLRVEDVAEVRGLGAAARAEVAALARSQRAANPADRLLDRDGVWVAKREALTMVHTVARTPARQAAYADFLRREGQGLRDFATWCALAEVHGPDWSTWPPGLQDPRSAEVVSAVETLAGRVDFFCWLQWVADEQLGAAQRRARESGMALGIVHDLAVGVHPQGADTWALREVMARGISVGAPPDAFNQQGQDWSQPPWRPDRLAEAGYTPYRDMLRTVLRHAGGVRVDHVSGLFRLWWVPEGRPPSEGTYVRFDHEALVGILALEAQRAGAVVVGEDLGTVEPWVRDYLAERGLLGTSVLWFERDEHGLPRPPGCWRELCLATVTTHDLPPTAGYLAGEHVRLRAELGLLTRPVDDERRIDAQERSRWLDLLVGRGWLAADRRDDEQAVVAALHRALASTPSVLRGVALADVVGDRRVVNQPGTRDEYPNWRTPLADGSGRPVLLEDILASARVATLVAAVLGRRND